MRRIGCFCSACLGLFKGALQLLYGAWKLGRLPGPMVTIFGSAQMLEDNPYVAKAHELGHMLVKENISVITGGGPGIMKGASCGATDEIRKKMRALSIGITVKGLDEKPMTACAQEYITVDYFFARKWLMINYSVAFAVFPGGFGTLDELAEVLTLIKTKKLAGVPIVLIGKAFWAPLLDWFSNNMVAHAVINREDMQLMHVTDNLQEAVSLLKERCQVSAVPVHKIGH